MNLMPDSKMTSSSVTADAGEAIATAAAIGQVLSGELDVAVGRIDWVGQLVVFNLGVLSEGISVMLTVDQMPLVVRWLATALATAFFAGGWWLMLRRAPVAGRERVRAGMVF